MTIHLTFATFFNIRAAKNRNVQFCYKMHPHALEYENKMQASFNIYDFKFFGVPLAFKSDSLSSKQSGPSPIFV